MSSPTEAEVKDLHAKIGRLAVENDFLSEGLNALGQQAMILVKKRAMMKKIDRVFTKFPLFGSR